MKAILIVALALCAICAPAYELSFINEVNQPAHNCEFYIQGFGIGGGHYLGYSTTFLWAEFKVNPNMGKLPLTANVLVHGYLQDGEATKEVWVNTLRQDGSDKDVAFDKTGYARVSFPIEEHQHNMVPGYDTVIKPVDISFYITVRSNDGVEKYWLSQNKGQGFSFNETMSGNTHPASYGNIGFDWCEQKDKKMFDQKRVCSHLF